MCRMSRAPTGCVEPISFGRRDKSKVGDGSGLNTDQLKALETCLKIRHEKPTPKKWSYFLDVDVSLLSPSVHLDDGVLLHSQRGAHQRELRQTKLPPVHPHTKLGHCIMYRHVCISYK